MIQSGVPQYLYRQFDTGVVTMPQKQVYIKNGVKIQATENGTYMSVHFNLKGIKQGYTEQIRKDKFEILMFLGEFKQIA